jgi:hypothetical protein
MINQISCAYEFEDAITVMMAGIECIAEEKAKKLELKYACNWA